MATIATQSVPVTGLDPVWTTPAAGGDRVAPGALIAVRNGNASPLSVTFDVIATVDGDLAIPDRVISGIAATTGFRFLKVPNNSIYADPADGLVKMTCSVQSSVTFAVISTA